MHLNAQQQERQERVDLQEKVTIVRSMSEDGAGGETSKKDGPSSPVTKKEEEKSPQTDSGKQPDDPSEEKSPSSDDKAKKEDEDKAKKEAEEARKKKAANWPLRDIKEPHDNDVLYGRGGGTNHHPGNKRYRKMVEDRKIDYVNSKRLDKPLVALEIIRHWRAQDPPGRFLKLDEKTGLWSDVGDKKAREKTSQALREKAPLLRRQQEELEEGEKSPKKEGEDGATKSTRFAEGTAEGKKDGKNVKRAILARDHSLGRDYLQPNEAVSLEGFSWAQPVEQIYGSPRPSGDYDGRHSSGSRGGHPHQQQHHRHSSSGGSSSRSQGEWGHVRSGSSSMPPPPVPPGPYGSSHHGRSDSYGRTASQGRSQSGREHSLSGNALKEASISGPARGFEDGSGGKSASEYWKEPPSMPPGPKYQPQRPAPRYLNNEGSSAFSRTPSGREGGERRTPSSGAPPIPVDAEVSLSRSGSGGDKYPPAVPTSPKFNVDPLVARTWSGQSDDYAKVANMMGDDMSDMVGRAWSQGSSGPLPGGEYSPNRRDSERKRSSGGGGPLRSPFGPSSDNKVYPAEEYPRKDRSQSFPGRSQSREYSAGGGFGPVPDGGFGPRASSSPPRGGGYGGASGAPGSPRRSGYDTSASAAFAKSPLGSGDTGVSDSSPKTSLRRKLMGPYGVSPGGGGGGEAPSSARGSFVAPLPGKRDRGGSSGVSSISSSGSSQGQLPRPNPVKRNTSNQNETVETKKLVKRAVLSRDHSLAAQKLKEGSVAAPVPTSVFDDDAEMRKLERGMSQSKLSGSAERRAPPPGGPGRPKAYAAGERVNTIDAFAFDLDQDPTLVKPEPLSNSKRTATMDAIESALGGDMPKPSALSAGNRLSTMDVIESMALGLEDDPLALSEEQRGSLGLQEDSAGAWEV